MKTLEDLYPSRVVGAATFIERVEPVVYSGPDTALGPLDEETLLNYAQSGFIFLESLFSEPEVAAMQRELDELRANERVRQSEIAVTEALSGEIRSIFAVHTVSDPFLRLASDERLLGMARQILGSDVYLHQARVNFKPGFRGGPLMLMPGSHRKFCPCEGRTPDDHYLQSLKKQDYGVPGDAQLKWMADEYGIVVPKGPVGSVTLFDCNLMHGSNGNITPYPRSNAFFVYNSIDNALEEPYAAEHRRPWFLGNREPQPLVPLPFDASEREGAGALETA